ncbi:hypothetical protein BJY16_005838 [Actinoplanes octamycinicus]|uniref:Uncharacterized protein n=1 Tax=Actinoplanes octamycinicus TaxID=135948 RepID=A0A7W7H227_9ACTN|nr:hypothetical protein [Actinoplanes octamycinicus]MBB4742379.1 hypothetical protein [Actinoplanes octamycinicus]GIE62372.1 hypothetical protein Aoc01nite_77740 [Actinoplanes octamycinicus]
MGFPWRDAAQILDGLLRRYDVDPDHVHDVPAAWQAFTAFLALPVDGLEPVENDADGFMVQWGRYSWNDRLPSVAFTRQFAVDVRDAWTAPEDWYQPELWQVNLEMVFPDTPELAGVGRSSPADTGLDFSAPGPERNRAIRAVEQELARQPALQAAWASSPARSGVTLYAAD